MEDVITDAPPPSRFFPDDLDNFASPSSPLPLPFLLFSGQNNKPPRPSTLVIAASPASCYVVHHLSPKTLIGALFLPELPLAGCSLEPSPGNTGCSIYAAGEDAVLVSFQYPVAADRARAVAKRLLEDLSPAGVLVLDSVRSGGFRGCLSADEALVFKLETAEQRAAGSGTALRSVPYYPTGSVADGLSAALLAECQMKKLRGTLCLTWPEAGDPAAVSLLEAVLRDFLPPDLGLRSDKGIRVTGVESDLYV
ncbi:hypothetical protein Taro_008005 [Colocasia esculenta]|uniref:Proteasome assembly chaperone 1 n=1 Tax=Colocasia esculenta TaxID=4460 RepID=A0A843TX12_COLES|nr:hypothetical protein [Colocasia esculenta]